MSGTEHSNSPEQRETIQPRGRVVVFGKNLEGAGALRKELKDYLDEAGVGDVKIAHERQVDRVREAFFDDYPTRTTGMEALPAGEPKSPRMLSRVLGALSRRGVDEDGARLNELAPPAGVIIFPEMRYFDGMHDMNVGTPYDLIEGLCEEYGVPSIRAELLQDTDEGFGLIAKRLQQLEITEGEE